MTQSLLWKRALGFLGLEGDEESLYDLYFQPTIDEILSSYLWSFAIEDCVGLTGDVLTVSQEEMWEQLKKTIKDLGKINSVEQTIASDNKKYKVFFLPAPILRVVKISTKDYLEYQRCFILTKQDVQTLNIKYIKQVLPDNIPTFVYETIENKLAHKIALVKGMSDKTSTTYYLKYEKSLADAKYIDVTTRPKSEVEAGIYISG